MKRMSAPASQSLEAAHRARKYSTVVLSSPVEIALLAPSIRGLVTERDTMLEPAFFLASASSEWTPRIILVKCGEALAGAVYAKERRIAGLSTGLIYLDGRLGNLVAAEAWEREEVLGEALRALLSRRGVRGIRLAIPPGGPEARAVATFQAQGSLDVSYSFAGLHAHSRLTLPGTYQEFIDSLGYNTRRNFRRYRRKFEEKGNTYVCGLSVVDVRRATGLLATSSRIHSRPLDIDRGLRVIAAVDEPWGVGLKNGAGRWISVAAGWFNGDRATMFLQLNNDLEYPDASLSLVLRTYLIESLIAQKRRELVFWSGSETPYTVGIPSMGVHLDVPSVAWRAIRAALRVGKPYLPSVIAAVLDWISAPPAEPPHLPARAHASSGRKD